MLYAGVAELADAPALGAGGQPWGFKSLHPHEKTTVFAGLPTGTVLFYIIGRHVP